jgi:hypothetical protein
VPGGAPLGAVSEKVHQAMIVELAALAGWRTFHPYDSRRSAPGFPDLTMVRGTELLFVECSTDRGKLTGPQREWLAALGQTGAEAVVWRPRHWPEIEQRLVRSGAERSKARTHPNGGDHHGA